MAPGGVAPATVADRLKTVLARLAVADTHDEVPAEGWHFAIGLLESFAAHGRADLGTASLDLHRVFFPMLGTQRMAAAQAAIRKGTFVPPPPMHPYFATAFEWIVVNDHEGPQRARTRHRTSDHAIGLSRCIVAGAVQGTPGGALGLGSGLAALTHTDSKAKALGGFLALLAHHYLRGATLREAFDAANAHAAMSAPTSALAVISEAAKMGAVNGLPVADVEYLPCSEVARVLGRVAVGKAHPSDMVRPGPSRRSLMPVVFPFSKSHGVEITGSRNRRIAQVVDAAVAAGVIG